jgi:2-polyprenyl-3-methyl-5-hydroxy-6-metoxy-1,4-benzoquinol methylase
VTTQVEPTKADDSSPQRRCWICGAARSTLWSQRKIARRLQPEDLQITDRRYGATLTLLRCQECGFIYAEGEELDELFELYSQLEDSGYQETLDTRALQMRWLVEQALRDCPQAKTALDIGAGAGLLIRECAARGLDAVGVEPSQSLVRIGREEFGLALHQGTFPHPALAGRKFDLVFLVDVIEHVPAPVELLRAAGEALTGNGRFVLVTPDVGSLAARLGGKRWWHFRLAHVGYFNRTTLSDALRRAGLEPLRFTRAKWFFPVGYLAERLSSYLPIGWFNRLASRTPGLRRLYRATMPLNLFDSWLCVARRLPPTDL